MLIWALVIVPVLLGLLAQRRVQRTFLRYRGEPDRSGLSGGQLARALLDMHGLWWVGIEPVPGTMTDHYDAEAHVLRLSSDVGPRATVAAIGVAAHEVAHVYQDVEGSRLYRVRRSIGEPLVRAAPWSGPVLVGGVVLGSLPLMLLACLYMAGLVLFSVVTLPVELQASRRALSLLQRTGVAAGYELDEIREVLQAAALTYEAGIAQRLGLFAALVLLAVAAFGVPQH